ncbi:MAG: DUF6036 family nucleotidyltransferase [Armatimonadota bacterium]
MTSVPHSDTGHSHLHEIAAIITTAFETLGLFLPIVVGGLAVETYTSGNYTTEDIDFIHPDPSEPACVMDALGFQSKGRYFIYPILDVYVEFPNGPLDGEWSRVIEVSVNDNNRIIVIGLEDIIIDRIAAYQNWDKRNPNSPDGTQAVNLLAIQHDAIDYDYLRKAAIEKGYGDALAELQARADKLIASL